MKRKSGAFALILLSNKEKSLPLVTCCGAHQLTVQHQCPAADSYRAELPMHAG